MGRERVRAATHRDWESIETLLRSASLPLQGAKEIVDHFVVLERDGQVVACAALEPRADAALLRSVAVREDLRGTGVGRELVRHLLEQTEASTVVLLTTTAADWFPRFGFHRVSREEVPESVTSSVEFRGACPSTAVVMMREKGGQG